MECHKGFERCSFCFPMCFFLVGHGKLQVPPSMVSQALGGCPRPMPIPTHLYVSRVGGTSWRLDDCEGRMRLAMQHEKDDSFLLKTPWDIFICLAHQTTMSSQAQSRRCADFFFGGFCTQVGRELAIRQLLPCLLTAHVQWKEIVSIVSAKLLLPSPKNLATILWAVDE